MRELTPLGIYVDNCPLTAYNSGAVPDDTLFNIALEVYYRYRGIMETFQEKVRALRVKRGWSQEDLARQIEVSLSTVQRWETKGSKPTRLARRELRKLFIQSGIELEE